MAPFAVALVLMTRAASTLAQEPEFVLGAEGCPMAHCDVRMSDNANLPAPSGDVGIVWRRDPDKRALVGLGCASNGTVAACTFAGETGDNLVVYDWDGNRVWSSRGLLSDAAFLSAPMVADDGSVIAADEERVVRFDPSGGVVWETETPGGFPLSPVLTESGLVVLATSDGPISAYRSTTGELVGELTLRREPGSSATFSTINTPAVRGNRIYVSAEKDGPNVFREGRLVVVDVAPFDVREAWHFELGARSGASPLAIGDTIYFDGDRPSPGLLAPKEPTIFAVRDAGDRGELVWQHTVESGGQVEASLARDPRGGVWHFAVGDRHLVRLDASDGSVLERVDVDALVNDPARHLPASAMTIAESETGPVLIVSAAALFGKTFVIAIDLDVRAVRWQVRLARFSLLIANGTASQFPILRRGCDTRIVFTTVRRGVFALGPAERARRVLPCSHDEDHSP